MITIVKSEWHQVERKYGLDIDEEILQKIYPDFTGFEIQEVMDELKSGEITAQTLLEDATANGVSLDFDWLDEDDWVSDCKGDYEVTYEVVEKAELSCPRCSWEGSREQAVIEDALLVCPECGAILGHEDDSPQIEASWETLRNSLYDMMKKDV